MQEPDLSLIRHLKSRGKFEEAHEQLEQWMSAQPNSPYLELEMAGIEDELGRPGVAVPYYQAALAHDPPMPLAVRIRIGLGNDLRALGRIHESRLVLEDARTRGSSPNPALDLFYALTLWQDHDYSAAFRLVWQMADRSGGRRRTLRCTGGLCGITAITLTTSCDKLGGRSYPRPYLQPALAQ